MGRGLDILVIDVFVKHHGCLSAKKQTAQRKMRQVVYSGGRDRYRSGNE